MTLAASELIHSTAIIGPEVDLAPDVQVGPYAVIEGPVRIGPGCVIESHSCVTGPLEMGEGNLVSHGAVLGKSPQHRGYKGEYTRLTIGDHNQFREHVTIHRGTPDGGGETRIGSRNLFMVGSHLGHDAQVGDGCTLVNGALVAGHVVLQDHCILSGHSAVQQRVRVGRLAMLSGLGSTSKDVPPFVIQQGYNSISALNVVGLRRSGVPTASINALRAAFRILYKEGRSLQSSLDGIEADWGDFPEVAELLAFIRESTTGINPIRDRDRRHRLY